MSNAPKVFAKEPAALKLEAGKTYQWCACGKSNNQPFCDASHDANDPQPVAFIAKDEFTLWLCNCKYTRRPPFCDGAHNKLEKIMAKHNRA